MQKSKGDMKRFEALRWTGLGAVSCRVTIK